MGEPPKKEYPPGWNDPPMLSYNSANPPPKTRIANKRVAFPLDTQTGNQGNNSMSTSKIPPIPSDTQCVESLFLNASENFNKLLEKTSDESVKEQIWQMLSAWQSHKLSANIQNKLNDLSVNMINFNETKISEIHLQLMMDSSPHVTAFLPALKHLINSSK